MEFAIFIVTTASLVVSGDATSRRCSITPPKRKPCGYRGIPEDYCWGSGCCYDASRSDGSPWCFSGSSNRFLDEKMLTLLRLGGVPPDVIIGLYVDATPGAEWLMAFRNGHLDTGALLSRISGVQLNLSPTLSKLLAGQDPIKHLLSSFAAASGVSAEIFELAFDRKVDVILKHILYLLSAKNITPRLPYGILTDVIDGKPLDSTRLIRYYVEGLMPTGDLFQQQFYKELLAGNSNNAIQWAYLSALRNKIPQQGLYPKNVGIFSHLVRTQKNYPGKISPALILALAKGDVLPGLNPDNKPFVNLFGVSANQYVCAAHSPNLQIACENLKGRLYPTSKECLQAKCCLREPDTAGQPAVCYENVLGSIGVYLAQSVIDEEYITDVVLGGSLPSLDNFIPWLPSTKLPSRFTNWLSSGGDNLDLFIDKYPTVAPLGPTKLRPGFKWKPHGPTTFPFHPKLPGPLLVPTQAPGILNPYPDPGVSGSSPLIVQLQLSGFGSPCRAVQEKDKVSCISNSIALSRGGHGKCSQIGCCYDADVGNLSVPACFRLVSYGQCYKVKPSEREECGKPGISRKECLKNPQCCFDSALPVKNIFDRTPWCYYKKRAPLLSKDKCTRVSTKIKCFQSDSINAVVSKATCESAGCCYDDSLPSAFDVAIGRNSYSPFCFRPANLDLTPTEYPDPVPTSASETKCLPAADLSPHARIDCGFTSPFQCRVSGCCYDVVLYLPNVPWCYKKTTVAI